MRIAEHMDASFCLKRGASLTMITQHRHRSPCLTADVAQFSTIPYEIYAWIELKWTEARAINLHCSLLCDSYHLKFSHPTRRPLRKFKWAPEIFRQDFKEARLSLALRPKKYCHSKAIAGKTSPTYCNSLQNFSMEPKSRKRCEQGNYVSLIKVNIPLSMRGALKNSLQSQICCANPSKKSDSETQVTR